jgi:hypothetical protein
MSFPIGLYVRVVQPDSSQRGYRWMAGWRIEAAFKGAAVNGAGPVTEPIDEGDDFAEAWWDLEVVEPTIGVALTAIPQRDYRPVRASCGAAIGGGGGPIPIAFEGNTITFTREVQGLDEIICNFAYVGLTPSPSVRPALPPTDTIVDSQGATTQGSEQLPLAILAGAVAGVLFVTSRRAPPSH